MGNSFKLLEFTYAKWWHRFLPEYRYYVSVLNNMRFLDMYNFQNHQEVKDMVKLGLVKLRYM